MNAEEIQKRCQRILPGATLRFAAPGVQVFEQLGVPYGTVDVLSDGEVRDQIKAFSNWPTIPQVYIDGKFVGGCDIIRELYESGELQTMVKTAVGATAAK